MNSFKSANQLAIELKDRLQSRTMQISSCENRRNELQHRQNILFKILSETLKKFEPIGFTIVFTGKYDLICRTKDGDCFPFPQPAFALVRKDKSKKVYGVNLNSSEQERLQFIPKINTVGAIEYTFTRIVQGKSDYTSGTLSWQESTQDRDQAHWFINALQFQTISSAALTVASAESFIANITQCSS